MSGRLRPAIAGLLCAAACCCWAGVLWADDAVEAGREAFARSGSFPWYDAQQDSIRRVNVPANDKSAGSGNRNSDWVEDRSSATAAATNTGGRWSTFSTVLVWSIVGLITAGLLTLIIWLIVRAYLSRETGTGSSRSSQQFVELSSDVDRVEQLPFQVKRPQADLLAEARRHYDMADYREAIIYLYSYMLVQLDRHHIIRLARGKTNRQYLREVPHGSRLAELLEITMIAFEEVFFGDHQLDRAQFDECWRGLSEFQTALTKGVAA